MFWICISHQVKSGRELHGCNLILRQKRTALLTQLGFDSDMSARIVLHLPETYLRKFDEQSGKTRAKVYYRGLSTSIASYDPKFVGNQGELFFSEKLDFALKYAFGLPGEQDQGIVLKFLLPESAGNELYNLTFVKKARRQYLDYASQSEILAGDYGIIVPDDRIFLASIGFVKDKFHHIIDWVPYLEAVKRNLIKDLPRANQ